MSTQSTVSQDQGPGGPAGPAPAPAQAQGPAQTPTQAPSQAPAPTTLPTLRVARPSTDLARTTSQWTAAWSLTLLTSFADHARFDGIILGVPGAPYHFEFTLCTSHPVQPVSTEEDLTVFYYPDEAEWREACRRAEGAGWRRVVASNPYWEEWGATWEDADGYRVVAARRGWTL